MTSTYLLAVLVTAFVLIYECHANAIDQSVSLAAANGDYASWANYYKKSETKLDSVLTKCFECISEKSGEKARTHF